MWIAGPSHPCLLLARVSGDAAGSAIEGADGVLISAGSNWHGDQLRAVEVRHPREIAVACDLLVLRAAEIEHRPLIEACSRSGAPTAIFTAGATLKQITRAAGWYQLGFRSGGMARQRGRLEFEGGARLMLVHAGNNVRAIERIRSQTFQPIGYEGDHPSLALAAGAVMLLHQAGTAFAEWAKGVRMAERALGDGRLPAESVSAQQRYLIAARDLARGSVLEPGDLEFSARTPEAGGIPARHLEHTVGRATIRHIAKGEIISADALEGAAPEQPEWYSPRPPRQQPRD